MLAGLLAVAFVGAASAPASADDVPPLFRATGAVPVAKEALVVSIDHRWAVTEHRQLVTSDGPGQAEGVYQLTTPEGAVVTAFSYWNGDDEIRGELFERGEATAMYGAVTRAQRDPGLLEQVAPAKFRYRIFPFAPGESKRVSVRWQALLPAHGRVVEYRAPLARPDTRVVVDIEGAAPAAVRSDTHAIEVEPTPRGARVRAVGPRGGPTGHFALRYEIAPAAAATADVEAGRDAFVALDFPAFEAAGAPRAHDVTFVVDRSGGAPPATLDRARVAVEEAIGRLARRDRVNVIAFDDAASPLYPAPRDATPEVVRDAQAFTAKIRDGAGTDLARALAAALGSQSRGPDRDRVVVLVTDGVTARAPALSAAAERRDVRVVALALGDVVDAELLGRVAGPHDGVVEVVRPSEDVPARLARGLDRALSRRATNVKLEIGGVAGVELGAPAPSVVAAGERVRAVLRCRPGGVLRARLTGEIGNQPIASSIDVDLGNAQHRPWVATEWGNAKMDRLSKSNPLDRDAIVDVAIEHDLVSPYTAFFAIPATEAARVSAQLAAARRRKRDAAWARADDVAEGSAQTVQPPPPPPAREEVAVNATASHAATAERASPGARGCGGCTFASTDRRADRIALLVGAALAVVAARRRRGRSAGGAS